MRISKAIKPLIILPMVVGFALIGYLGYRLIRWIVHKCQRTQKIEEIAQENISTRQISYPLAVTRNIADIKINPDKVKLGQGEYIIFHQLSDGEKKQLSQETFEQVYQVLIQYAPLVLINSGSERAKEECLSRDELIKNKLKEIDPTLEAAFIPRTLYELFFIRKCIKEDLKHHEICPFLDVVTQKSINQPESMKGYRFFNKTQTERKQIVDELRELRIKRKCWHLCYFEEIGDNHCIGVKSVAYRLNQSLIKNFNPTSEGFSYEELINFAEKEINFLKNYHEQCNSIDKEELIQKVVRPILHGGALGPTINFGYEFSLESMKSMGIRNETDAQIIRNAITLECSLFAQHSVFLYRGSNIQEDSITYQNSKTIPYSLSYGSSVFAGCLYDGGATAFYHMRRSQNAYAIPIPFDQVNCSPFFVPPIHPIAQLSGDGEIFHGRTKAWKGSKIEQIKGIKGIKGRARDHLKSELNYEEMTDQFQRYKADAFQLK